MNKLLISLLIFAFFLSGCAGGPYSRVYLQDNKNASQLVLETREDSELPAETAQANGYYHFMLSSAPDGSILIVVPSTIKNMLNLDFQSGVYIVTNNDQLIPVSKDLISPNVAGGLNAPFQDSGRYARDIFVPMEKISDYSSVKGAMIIVRRGKMDTSATFAVLNSSVGKINSSNLISTDDKFEMCYIPFKQVLNKNNNWIIVPDTEKIKRKDLKDGFNFMFINLTNSSKNIKSLYEALIKS